MLLCFVSVKNASRKLGSEEVSALAICFRALALLNKNQQMTVLRYLCQKCGVDWIRGLVDIPLEDPPQGKGKLR